MTPQGEPLGHTGPCGATRPDDTRGSKGAWRGVVGTSSCDALCPLRSGSQVCTPISSHGQQEAKGDWLKESGLGTGSSGSEMWAHVVLWFPEGQPVVPTEDHCSRGSPVPSCLRWILYSESLSDLRWTRSPANMTSATWDATPARHWSAGARPQAQCPQKGPARRSLVSPKGEWQRNCNHRSIDILSFKCI